MKLKIYLKKNNPPKNINFLNKSNKSRERSVFHFSSPNNTICIKPCPEKEKTFPQLRI